MDPNHARYQAAPHPEETISELLVKRTTEQRTSWAALCELTSEYRQQETQDRHHQRGRNRYVRAHEQPQTQL